MNRHRDRLAAALLTVTAMVAGLVAARVVDGPPDLAAAEPVGRIGSGPVGVVPAGLERFYGQRLAWTDCQRYGETDSIGRALVERGLRCATMEVPLNYAAPAGTTVRIAVARLATATTGARIGSLVTNPGGPGVSGLSAAVGLAGSYPDTELGRHFDLVTFDPRGVGASEPTVRCLTDAELDAVRRDPAPDASAAAYANLCATRVGPAVLSAVGSRETARDLDVLRSVLGDERLTYLGYSYGSHLATEYARQFPANVRAMLLDGAVDPSATLDARSLEQATGFQAMFDRYARWCTTKRTCPLGTDRTRAAQRLDALLARTPWPIRVGDRVLTRGDAVLGVRQVLYGHAGWGRLNVALAQLNAGAGGELLGLADRNYGRADLGYGSGFDVAIATQCLDYPRLTEAEQRRRLATDGGLFDAGGLRNAVRYCHHWPVPPTSTTTPVVGLPQVLVVSATGDPATSYREGSALATALGARLLTYDDHQHGVFLSGNPCVDEAGIRYLVSTTVPPTGLVCRP